MPEASTLVSRVPGEYTVGDVIGGKYRLERPLGEGGQGWVWQARNEILDVRVAIKVVRSDAVDETQKRRLHQEARSAAQLGHPAIVRVFDYGQTDGGDPFLVMELLDGMSLGDRLVQNRLSDVEAARVLLPIADALVAAHGLGLVHRDLKPDNVFLALSGDSVQPKLLDFGVVKIQPSAGPPSALTETGAVVGSPAYLSPEQARGRDDIDLRADVWSFSAMLYECVTGDLPFQGSNYNALLRSIVEDPPRSTAEAGVSDEAFWRILERGLAKSREDRWPTMAALGRALAAWLVERGTPDDVCGVSLDFKWLRSQTPRPVSALPGSVAARREAVRAVAPPPPSAASATPSVAPAKPRRYWLLGAAVFVVALTALSIRLLSRADPPPAPEEAAAALPSPPEQVPVVTAAPNIPEPSALAVVPEVSASPPIASAAASAAPRRAGVERGKAPRASAAPAASTPPRAPQRREPDLDLLTPY